MASTQFRTVPIEFTSDPSTEGVLSEQGAASFDSNVVSAGVAIQSWRVSYGADTDHEVQTVGAAISDVSWNGVTVSFTASLQLTDRSQNILQASDCAMTVMVTAYIE